MALYMTHRTPTPRARRASLRERDPGAGAGRTRAPCRESNALHRAVRVSQVLSGLQVDVDADRWLVSDGPGVAVRFINRPDATPLTTIIEQKSIATLRSAKSLAAVARPITSKHANRCADGAEQKQIRRDHADRRQAALTVDEATLRELHEIIDSQVPAAQRVCSGSASECVNDVENPTHPISPPLPPLFRAQTPCGLPRWPGDLPTSFHLPPRRASRARSFGNALRDFFRGPREGELRIAYPGTLGEHEWGTARGLPPDVVPTWRAHV